MRLVLRLGFSTLLVLLGLLWALQGTNLIRIRPLLCFADCQPLTGGSTTWLCIGVVTMAVGIGMLWSARRPR